MGNPKGFQNLYSDCLSIDFQSQGRPKTVLVGRSWESKILLTPANQRVFDILGWDPVHIEEGTLLHIFCHESADQKTNISGVYPGSNFLTVGESVEM